MSDTPTQVPTQEELLDTLQQWENRLHQTRSEQMQAHRVARDKRGRVAECLQLWQTGGVVLTHAELIKQHLASEKELRRRRIEDGLSPQRNQSVGPSRVDREGAYSMGGSAEDHVRRHMQRGWRRGGLTATQAAHANAERIRRRLPSER